jgi:hypothetical protein
MKSARASANRIQLALNRLVAPSLVFSRTATNTTITTDMTAERQPARFPRNQSGSPARARSVHRRCIRQRMVPDSRCGQLPVSGGGPNGGHQRVPPRRPRCTRCGHGLSCQIAGIRASGSGGWDHYLPDAGRREAHGPATRLPAFHSSPERGNLAVSLRGGRVEARSRH